MQFIPFPVLTTKRLVLREPRESDAQRIYILRSDPQVNQFVQRPLSNTPADAREFIGKNIQSIKEEKLLYWGICIIGEPELIGTICLWNFSEDRKTVELGYDMLATHHGNGYMTEALQAIVHFAFVENDVEAIEAFTQSDNLPSIRLLTRHEFILQVDKTDEHNAKNMIYRLERP